MRFGCLCRVTEMTAVADAGYDFGETEADVLYPGLEEEAFRRAREALRTEPLFPEVVQATELLHCTMAARERSGRVMGDLDVRTVFRRAAMVGAKVVVVTAPGYDALQRFNGQAKAWREATEAIGLLGEQAARCGLSVAVAPRTDAGGLATTIDEVWVLSEEVGHPAVGVSADVSTIADWADMAATDLALKHVHLPLPGRFGGEFSTERCLEALGALREFGYGGRVSVSAEWSTFADRAAELLEEMRAVAGG